MTRREEIENQIEYLYSDIRANEEENYWLEEEIERLEKELEDLEE